MIVPTACPVGNRISIRVQTGFEEGLVMSLLCPTIHRVSLKCSRRHSFLTRFLVRSHGHGHTVTRAGMHIGTRTRYSIHIQVGDTFTDKYENTHYLNWPKKKTSITRTVFDVGEPAAVFPCCIAAGCSPGTRTTSLWLVSALHFRFQPEHFVFSRFATYGNKKELARALCFLVPALFFSYFSSLFTLLFFSLLRFKGASNRKERRPWFVVSEDVSMGNSKGVEFARSRVL